MFDVIPSPFRVAPGAGPFRFRQGTQINYGDPALAPIVERFCRDVTRRTGIRPELVPDGRGALAGLAPCIRVEIAPDSEIVVLPPPIGVSPSADLAPDERYSLSCDRDRIVVRCAEAIGAARGLTTLLQMMATTPLDADGTLTVPAVRVLDAPRFAWRGLSVDVVRTFFSPADLRQIIDLLALYKFNVLHLHLTDDQAWRIAAGRPSRRGDDATTFYTNEDLRELAAYARERFVTIVPEIDTPAHASALLRLRPELDNGRNMTSRELVAGLPRNSTWLDPDLPATFSVLDEVLEEIADVFPSRFINIGGDEAFGMPETLYIKFVRHVRAYVHSLHKRTIGWQESVRAYAEPDHAIQYWISGARLGTSSPLLPVNVDALVAASIARARGDIECAMARGVPIIVSPVSHAYFDVPYAEPSADPTQERMRQRVGLQFHPVRTVAQSFDWEPVNALGLGAGPEHVAGVGGAIWTETIKDFSELTFMLLPRLTGVAQKGWGDADAATWDDHRRRLGAHGRLWAQDGLTYFKSSAVDWARHTNVDTTVRRT
jgi:hexosaminidase